MEQKAKCFQGEMKLEEALFLAKCAFKMERIEESIDFLEKSDAFGAKLGKKQQKILEAAFGEKNSRFLFSQRVLGYLKTRDNEGKNLEMKEEFETKIREENFGFVRRLMRIVEKQLEKVSKENEEESFGFFHVLRSKMSHSMIVHDPLSGPQKMHLLGLINASFNLFSESFPYNPNWLKIGLILASSISDDKSEKMAVLTKINAKVEDVCKKKEFVKSFEAFISQLRDMIEDEKKK